MIVEKIQNHGPPRSTSASSPRATNIAPAIRNATSVASPENTMTRCLRWRSTTVPNSIPNRAIRSMYAPPMRPVARTDLVSRYAQNVSANQRKLVVTLATAVLIST